MYRWDKTESHQKNINSIKINVEMFFLQHNKNTYYMTFITKSKCYELFNSF